MTVGDELKQPSPEWCQPIGFGCVNGGAGRGVTTQETTQETGVSLSQDGVRYDRKILQGLGVLECGRC